MHNIPNKNNAKKFVQWMATSGPPFFFEFGIFAAYILLIITDSG